MKLEGELVMGFEQWRGLGCWVSLLLWSVPSNLALVNNTKWVSHTTSDEDRKGIRVQITHGILARPSSFDWFFDCCYQDCAT